jgi:radical SAM protein with 4Fe4S-binding SPASM domain
MSDNRGFPSPSLQGEGNLTCASEYDKGKEECMEGQYLIRSDDLWGWKDLKSYTVFQQNSAKGYDVSPDGMSILELCNGKRTTGDVVKELQQTRQLNEEDIDGVRQFVRKLVDMDFLCYRSEPLQDERRMTIVGRNGTFQPVLAHVELCDACNLRCDYCYRDAGPEKHCFLDQPIAFFSEMYERGLRIIELTGGEPLMHPQIIDILEFTCGRFARVALLTNGILLSGKILDILEKYQERCALQVSVPSIRRERFVRITGKDLWPRLHQNLLTLKKRNIRFRFGMVMHGDELLDEMHEAAHLARSLGALQFVFSPYVRLGRARNSSMSLETMFLIQGRLRELQKEFPARFLGIVESPITNKMLGYNCGAGSRCVTFAPTKHLRPCPLFPPDEFSGNALRDRALRERLSQVIKPSPDICGQCRFLSFCNGCYLRGWIQYQEMQCEWGKSQHIDEIFTALRASRGQCAREPVSSAVTTWQRNVCT